MTFIPFLKHYIPSSLKTKLRYYLGVPSQLKSFHSLRNLGFIPKTVLDIGAYEGIWATDLKDIFTDCRILMIEGQTSKENILKQACRNKQGLEYKIALLGATETMVSFNIYNSASSILEENNDTGAWVEQRKLVCLDSLLINSRALKTH